MDENVSSIASYRDRLHADFPDLAIESVTVLGTGWDHIAVEVNNSLIFRLPRDAADEEASLRVRREVSVLRLMSGALPVTVPEVQFVAPNHTYFGYTRLPGVLLADIVPRFTKEDMDNLKRDWVTIALGIHRAISVDAADAAGIPRLDTREIIENARRVYEIGNFDSSLRQFADQTLEDALSLGTREPLSFIHNDLHFFNAVADPESKRITGIIDWSDCCIASLARELSIWEWIHDDSLQQVATLYEECSGTKVNVREARTWKHVEEIADFVEQTENGDHTGAAKSLLHLQQWRRELH